MQNTAIKPIETVYKGYRYRSRLEARWAVTLDTLGIFYEYEKEGFHLADGTPYLPDFWLPELEMWAEIKPDVPTPAEFDKAEGLIKGTKHPCLLIIGPPREGDYTLDYFCPCMQARHHLISAEFAICRDCEGLWLSSRYSGALALGKHTCTRLSGFYAVANAPRLQQALAAGGQARFEHGESGARS